MPAAQSLLTMCQGCPLLLQICTLAMPCYYTASSLAVLVGSYFLLFYFASQLIVPGGLFMCACMLPVGGAVAHGLAGCAASCNSLLLPVLSCAGPAS